MIKVNKEIIFSYNKRPIIIAEISGNHSGSKSKFLKLITSACLNGADLIKIQTYEAKDITLNKKNNKFKINKVIWKNKYLWDLYKKACTPFEWHYEAFKIAKKFKKILFSSPFSIRGVDFLESFNVLIYKIASFEITDHKLIDYIASKKKPIIISTGMASIEEINRAIKIINKYHNKIIIMHCVSNYPTKLEDTELLKINRLKKKFKKNLIGLSDHTNDIYSSIASIPLGVVAIEKHFKIDKIKTLDSNFSILPEQLKALKENSTMIHKSLRIQKKRNKYININLRRSIFAIQNINKNEKLTKKNIDTFRPNIGIPSENYFNVIGKKTKNRIKKFDAIYFKDLIFKL